MIILQKDDEVKKPDPKPPFVPRCAKCGRPVIQCQCGSQQPDKLDK